MQGNFYSMSEKERKEILEGITTLKTKVTISKTEAVKYLQRVGVLTKKGLVKKEYKEICIRHVQD